MKRGDKDAIVSAAESVRDTIHPPAARIISPSKVAQAKAFERDLSDDQ